VVVRIKNLMTDKYKKIIFDVFYDIIGSAIFSLGIHTFIAPNNIAPGGVSGLSILINYLFGFPIGLTSFILNIPLLILSFVFLGKKSTVKTLKTIAILTVILDILFVNVPVYTGDRILSSLFGGVCIGIGLAVIFMRGSTTGGTDIASRLIQLKFPHMQIGRVIFIIDFAVLVLSAIVYKDIEAALYGMLIIFTSTTMLDSVLYGVDKGKMAIIISCEWQSICEKITQSMQRGATILKASGAFSNEEKNVILCAVRKNQFFKLKKIVYELDPKAFIIVSDAGEILGEGFKPLNKTN